MSEMNEMQVTYQLKEKKNLFSVAYAIYSNRDRILQKHDKVQPFHQTLRVVLIQFVLLYVLAVVFLLGMMQNGFDVTGVILLVVCVLYGMVMVTSWANNRRDYRYAEGAFLRSTGETGTLRFTDWGLTDVSESGKESSYAWSEYRYCFITDETIVILFVPEREEMLLMSRDDETEQALRGVLKEFDMIHTIREVAMKGKKK